jgi:voltage-gated potassium channel
MADAPPRPGPYDLFALALSIFALILLGARVGLTLDPETNRIIDWADLIVCVFFFCDFITTLARAPDRMRYLYTWGWLDLAASIPAIDAFRIGRVGRVVRILRVLRIFKASRMVAMALATRRRGSAIWAAVFIAIVVVFSASIAVLEFERVDGNIKTAEDAVWWAITTITTVGYGDRYPVTTEGRIVAVALMIVGAGLFGTLTGAAAAWFMQPAREA